MATFGYTSEGGSNVSSGFIRWCGGQTAGFTTTEAGTLTTIHSYVRKNAGTELAAAIYSHLGSQGTYGSPRDLLAEDSGNVAINVTAGWHENSISYS